MKISFSPAIALAQNISAGDLISYQVTKNTLMSGRVTGVASVTRMLTLEQKNYMRRNNLSIPDDDNAPLCDDWSLLIFGEFVGSGKLGSAVGGGHAYVMRNALIVFFPSDGASEG